MLKYILHPYYTHHFWRNNLRILATDGLSAEGEKIIRSTEGIDIIVNKRTEVATLLKEVKNYQGLIIRSATKVTKEVIDAAEGNLKVIGRAGIGVDNIDVEAATRNGIVVMNTPEANAITTAEHSLALLFSLARNIPQAHHSLAIGKWERNKYKGVELYGKTIGFIGLGKIGKLVAERSIGIKMKAIAYDPFLTRDAVAKLGVELVSFDELLERSDIISIHTPFTKETKDLINSETISKMKQGVLLINCARGGIVNEEDLAKALKEGRIAGAGMDVYSSEPIESDNPLLSVDEDIVHTPHLGASTEEAQRKVGVAIAEQIVDFATNGVVRNAVNMPSLDLEQLKSAKPYLSLAEKIGSLHGQICKEAVKDISIEFAGEVAKLNTESLTIAALKGFLTPIMDMVVTYVNAPIIAKERSIKVVESKTETTNEFTNLIKITVTSSDKTTEISGTIFGKDEPRFVRLNGIPIDVKPQGYLLYSENYDKPGFIGSMTSLLGENGVNIGLMHLGREKIGGRAIVFTNVDSPISEELMNKIGELPFMISLTQVNFK